MFWKLFGKQNQEEVDYIEKVLRDMPKPHFAAKNKAAVKNHILNAIKSGNTQIAPVSMLSLEQNIKHAGLSVKLVHAVKALIKERIMDRIERAKGFTRSRLFLFSMRLCSASRNGVFATFIYSACVIFIVSVSRVLGTAWWFFRTKFIAKRAATYALVVLIMVTGVFSFIARPQAAYAYPVTVLHEINGDVVVLRGGQAIVPNENFTLYQNDIIDTRDGTATVKYFDNSVSRLDKNTKIRFSRLYSDDKGLKTAIELDFDSGQAWSMVFDLFNDSVFDVRIDKLTASVVDRATFSISAISDKTEIGVFSNLVNLTFVDNGESKKSVVLRGYKAVVESGGSVKPKLTYASKKNLSSEQKIWVEENMKKDKEYAARVARGQATQQFAENGTNNLKETTSLYLSLSEVEKLHVKLNIAESKFVAGEAMLDKGEIDEARVNILFLKQAVSDIKNKADEIMGVDPITAEKLMNFVNSRIIKYKKSLAMVTPDLPLYEAKKAIRDIEFFIAGSDKQKVRAMLDSISSILFETQDLVDDYKYENAKENLSESRKIIEDLQKMDLSKNPELFKEVVDKKADIVKMLTLIENTSRSLDIKKEAGAVKDSSIQAIMETASQSKGIAEPAVKEINNFIKTYDAIPSIEEDTNVSPKIQLFFDSRKYPAADFADPGTGDDL